MFFAIILPVSPSTKQETLSIYYLRAVLKDILVSSGTSTAVAIVKEIDQNLQEVWNAYFINLSDEELKNVFVTCKGYGMINNENRETAITRYFIGDVNAKSAARIEPVAPALFTLNNEYFVTYYLNGQMSDGKYTFKANTIFDDMLTEVPLLNKPGVIVS